MGRGAHFQPVWRTSAQRERAVSRAAGETVGLIPSGRIIRIATGCRGILQFGNLPNRFRECVALVAPVVQGPAQHFWSPLRGTLAMSCRLFSRSGFVLTFSSLFAWAGLTVGQEFVVQDRMAQARERVLSNAAAASAQTGQAPAGANGAGVSAVVRATPAANSVVEVGTRNWPGHQDSLVYTGAPVQQEPQNQHYEFPSNPVQADAGIAWNDGNAAYGPVDPPATVFLGEGYSRPGELEPGPYDYSWRRGAIRPVLTNTHWFDGPRGYGEASPFGFGSAYCRSGRGQTHDANGNPLHCDDWRTACGCNCCDEPWGLDMFKSRPYGPLPVKRHQCGCRPYCNGCGEGCGPVSQSGCATCQEAGHHPGWPMR